MYIVRLLQLSLIHIVQFTVTLVSSCNLIASETNVIFLLNMPVCVCHGQAGSLDVFGETLRVWSSRIPYIASLLDCFAYINMQIFVRI